MMRTWKWGMAWGAILGLAWIGGQVVEACPASYVKSEAKRAMKSNLGKKIAEVSDKYMLKLGVDPESAGGQIVRPYVIGTTFVDHEDAKYMSGFSAAAQAASYGSVAQNLQMGVHRIDNKSVDAAVRDCMNCYHHKEHFGDGKQKAGKLLLRKKQSNSYGG